MGVVGLWKILKPSGIEEIPNGKKLAVDVSIWIHQYKNMNGEDIVFYVSKRITKLLFHKIKPIFVFDGQPHPLKKEVLEKRRKENQTNTIKDIINNNICKICKIKIRICKHGGILNEKNRKVQDDEIFYLLENHNFNWGENINVLEEEFSDNKNFDHVLQISEEKKIEKEANNKNEVKLFDPKRFSGYDDILELMDSREHSDQYKLKSLVKMREKRKERLDYDDSNINSFSQSQLKNVRKRNLVSFFIRKLENKQNKRILSDSNRVFKFVKSNETQSRRPVVSKKYNEETHEETNNSSDEILSSFLRCDYTNIKQDEELNDSCLEIDENDFSDDDDRKITSLTQANKELDYDDLIVKSTVTSKAGAGFFGVNVFESTESSETSEELEFVNDEELSQERSEFYLNKVEDGFCDFTSKQTLLKNIIAAFNLPFIESPSESDSQCGYLCKEKIVDGVITEDNDILLYGGTVYKNFYRKNKSIEKYTLDRIESILGLSQVNLIDISYVLGSDYSIGIKGVGPKTVETFIRSEQFKNLSFNNYRSIFTNPSVKTISRIEFGIIDIQKIVKFLKSKDVSSERRNEIFFYLKQIKNT